MSMVPRDPFDVFMPMREVMARFFDDNFAVPRFDLLTGRAFPVDIYESQDGKQYVIEAPLSGFKPEEVHITAADKTLTIAARHEQETKNEKGGYVRRERYEGEMSRVITLPTTIDATTVEATYEHGLLTLHIPKAAATQPTQISIKSKEPVTA